MPCRTYTHEEELAAATSEYRLCERELCESGSLICAIYYGTYYKRNIDPTLLSRIEEQVERHLRHRQAELITSLEVLRNQVNSLINRRNEIARLAGLTNFAENGDHSIFDNINNEIIQITERITIMEELDRSDPRFWDRTLNFF